MESPTPGGVLLLLAHPDFKNSRANKALIDAVKELPGVEVENLYDRKGAPFDTDDYRRRIAATGTLVFQFPFYWASAPSEMKRWIDEVFTVLARERAVAGKRLLIATTAASEYDAYRSGGRNRFTADELLRPFQMTALHAGMEWLTPFVVYGLRDDAEAAREQAPDYRRLLLSLTEPLQAR